MVPATAAAFPVCAGQQVVTATAGSATTSSGYNAADWPITTTETSSDGAAPLTTAYGYDAMGQQRSETILDGQTPVTTTLDAEGRATSLAENAEGTGPYTSTFGYYPTDLPMTASVPGGKGVALNWTYDGSDRVTHAGLAGPDTGAVTTTLNSGYDDQYDPATGWTTALTGTVNTLYGGQPTPQLFTHDAQGRLRQWQWPTQQNLDERWTYDGNGNVTTNHEYIDGQDRTTTYTYTASTPNELQAQHTEGLGIESYTYDGYGNTTSLSATDALTGTYGVSDTIGYDSQARSISIRVKSQADSTITQTVFSTVSFGYNAQGQRSSYTVSTPGYPGYRASYRYRDGGPNVAQAVVASGTVTGTIDYTDTYLYDQGGAPYELLRQYQGQPLQRYWYEEDGQGDVVALTDSTGNVVDRYAYDPWGEGLAGTVSEQVPQPLRYRGYWWDPELGWYWVNVRSLDPEGRWLQPDPSQQDGVRTYAYAGNDPVDATDPTGLDDSCTNPEEGLCFEDGGVETVAEHNERVLRRRAAEMARRYATRVLRELRWVVPGTGRTIVVGNIRGIKYGSLDAYGRATGIVARITRSMIGTGSEASVDPAGYVSGRGFARGHLLAKVLGGAGNIVENLVPLYQNLANTPVMRKYELEVRDVVKTGRLCIIESHQSIGVQHVYPKP